MRARRLWYLNLDAEAELARRGAVTRSRATEERCAAMATRIVGLVPEGDAVLPGGSGEVGLAWCPTPHAVAVLRGHGAVVPEPPPWGVLRAANHRRFAAEIAQPLPGAGFVRDEGALAALLGEGSPTGVWLLKRALGHHGGGRLRVRGAAPDEAAWRWIRASLDDGLQVEPEVERVEDHGLHGYLTRDGEVTWGELTRQVVDARGQWVASERAGEGVLSEGERRALWESRERVAEGLRALGYRGPFGVDAFRWRDASGRARYNPLCEVNARYSMGWAVGMGDRRPDLGE